MDDRRANKMCTYIIFKTTRVYRADFYFNNKMKIANRFWVHSKRLIEPILFVYARVI